MMDNDDDASRSDSFDVPTDEEEEDIRQYQHYPASLFSPNVDSDAEEDCMQRPQRLTSHSELLPTTTMMTSPCLPPRSPRARRFTSLPLHLEASLASTTVVTATSSGTEQLPPSPRSLRRAGCSRVWLVLLAYVALITFPHPPVLHYNYHVEPSPMVTPLLKSDLQVLAAFRPHQPSQQVELQEQHQLEQPNQPAEQEKSPPLQPQQGEDQQAQQQPKRRLRQPLLAHARTNRQRQTAIVRYGGKPDASLLFLDNMEETPIQKRKVPRFFFSADRNHANDGSSSRSFFHNKREAPPDRSRQTRLPLLWWLLNKIAWLVLLAFTLETGVREIPRRFQAWTSLLVASPNHRAVVTVGSSEGSRRGTPIHSPLALSRTGSTPRQRRRA